MIRVQSTFLQPRKYDGLLLTNGTNGVYDTTDVVVGII